MRDHLTPILDHARPASPLWFTEENLHYWLSTQSPPKFGPSLTCPTALSKAYTLTTQSVRSPLLRQRLPDLYPAPGEYTVDTWSLDTYWHPHSTWKWYRRDFN